MLKYFYIQYELNCNSFFSSVNVCMYKVFVNFDNCLLNFEDYNIIAF